MAMLRADVPQGAKVYVECAVCTKRGLCELLPGDKRPLCWECATDLSPVWGGKRRGGLRHRWNKRVLARGVQRRRAEADRGERG